MYMTNGFYFDMIHDKVKYFKIYLKHLLIKIF